MITRMTDTTARMEVDTPWIVKVIYNMIYKATIEVNNKEKIYVNTTEMNWKNKWYNLKLKFNKRRYSNSTTLSKHT